MTPHDAIQKNGSRRGSKASPHHHAGRGLHDLGGQVPRGRKKTERLEGAALVIVLSFLIIITGLVVAFLSSITNEATATTASVAAVTTRTLADAAIQLDIAQIRDATAGFARNADGSLNTNSPVCWASQPGAIRTYGTNVSSGGGSGGGLSSINNGAIYKLYSSTNMVDTNGNNPTNDLPPNSTWTNNFAQYTDLNAPVLKPNANGTTNTNYPIMDPYMTNLTTGASGGSGGGLSIGSGQPIVDGFFINSTNPTISGVSNPAAMPVTWIYVLKNGSLSVPSSVSGSVASFTSNAPTVSNPIVGRIAFWTDDETCKLNVNTASEGSFWGTPSFSSSEDVSFARYPPSSKEFNRFPGHPASTCLSPVLWSYLGLTNPALFLSGLSGVAGVTTYNSGSGDTTPRFASSLITNYFTNLFYNVTPRYGWSNSSLAGTYSLVGTNVTALLPTNRLYSSIDEFFFAATNPLARTNRTTTPLNLQSLDVSRMRFFLTAESRAPEVNPLNLPKISIWPVPNNATNDPANPTGNKPTLTDQTIAFCSTLGTNAYYFSRYDPTSMLNDFSGRNTNVYGYLRNMLNQPMPGFNGSFSTNSGSASSSIKWSPLQADQICTEIFDYIRSCINLVDASSLTYDASGNLTGSFTTNAYTVPPTTNGSSINLSIGTGQVVPISIKNPDNNTTMGMGRFPVLKSAFLWFIARSANQPPLMCHPDGRPIVYDSKGNQISVYGQYTVGTAPNAITCGLPNITTIDITPGKTFTGGSANQTYVNGAMIDVVMGGNAYAKVNIMHPWNIPYANSASAPGSLFVPQSKYAGSPILADNTNAAAGTRTLLTASAPPATKINNANDLYPIFDLTQPGGNTTGTPPTGVYSSFNGQYNYLNTISIAASNNNPGSQGLIYNYFNLSCNLQIETLPAAVMAAPWKTVVGLNKLYPYYTAKNNQSALNYSHPGLSFLSVQDPNTGAFTIPNNSYWDSTPDNSLGVITYLKSGTANTTTTTKALPFHATRMEMAYIPNFVNISPGSVGMRPRFNLSVGGLGNFTAVATPLVFNSTNMGFTNHYYGDSRTLLYDQGAPMVMLCDAVRIPFYTVNSAAGIVTPNNAETFAFTGGTLTNFILDAAKANTIASVQMNFPNATFPIPKLNACNLAFGFSSYNPPMTGSNMYPTNLLSFSQARGTSYRYDLQQYGLFMPEMGLSESSGDATWSWYCSGLNHITADTIQSVDLIFGDARILSFLSNVPSSMFRVHPAYGNSNRLSIQCSTNASMLWPDYLRNAHSMRTGTATLVGGSYGTLLATNNGTQWTNDFQLPPQWEGSAITLPIANALGVQSVLGPILTPGPLSITNTPNFLTSSNVGGFGNFFGTSPGRSTSSYNSGNQGHCSLPNAGAECDFTSTGPGSFFAMWTNGGDFDNGFGFYPDGPFINKVDEGMGAYSSYQNVGINPYFAINATVSGATLFAANRIVPSPVIFGSLPVFDTNWDPAAPLSTLTNSSWRTLQFSPNPNALTNTMRDTRSALAGYNEAGGRITNTIPPDHLLLDFFQMPVVAPYPISDPFSTAGKVNMNYQIAPFSYIKRTSAIRGVLKPVMITAVDDQWSFNYKMRSLTDLSDNNSQRYGDSSINRTISGAPSYNTFGSNSGNFYFHYPINASNTLTQFDARFATNDLFHSPSEICSLWLYPSQQPKGNGEEVNPLSTDANGVTWTWDTSTNTSIKNWWYKNQGTTRKAMTGDNMRERPYSYLYPRLTTKSNTYQIHYRVQTLKQTVTAHGSGDFSLWKDPAGSGITDKILGEQRGSAVIERFIDPSDPNIPDFASIVSSSSSGLSLSSTNIMDSYYRFRVFNAKQFTP
jgi:uncharacterized protein (TIGR02600 family)